ncbi:MAG: IS1380 family transposase [Acidobacteria bacterium]|nr:IS1380 family transposase [Acidobacteriota bacterium]
MERRLDKTKLAGCDQPMFAGGNIHYEIADRARGIAHGGIGAIHVLAKQIGLMDAIDERLHLLKIHLPYHESDHVLNLAYNALCEGTCLDDIERRRNDEVFLDALGARRIPDPTTAGDFCRRFTPAAIDTLQDAFNEVRQRVWKQQPDSFFDLATIDMDGTLVETTGQCKQGMDIAYDGTWGYHPLVLSLANTGEVLWLVNRSGNRPSHEGAAEAVDRVVAVCRQGGFRKVLLRGDTDFAQSAHLDRWDAAGIYFLFGFDATPNLKAIAEDLPAAAWRPLPRLPAYTVQTQERHRPANVKEAIVAEREFDNRRLCSEEVAEFPYRPTACRQAYRMVVVRKNISVAKGEKLLFDEVRYFFYINNIGVLREEELVWVAHHRCHQENLLAQLHGGVRALQAPVNTLASNWAYMVMTALAWNLKAWWALLLPVAPGRWQERHREEKQWALGLEFKTFVQAFVRLPCQIVRTGRKLVYRLLSWNPYQRIFWRLVTVLRC